MLSSNWNRLSLGHKLVFVAGVVIIFTVTTLTSVSVTARKQDIQAQLDAQMALLLNNFARASTFSLQSQDFVTLQHLTETIAQQVFVSEATVYNASGQIVATSDRDRSNPAATVHVQKTVTAKIQDLGSVSLRLIPSRLGTAIHPWDDRYLGIAFLAISWGVGLTILIGLSLNRSLEQITKQAKQLEPKDSSKLLEQEKANEFIWLEDTLDSTKVEDLLSSKESELDISQIQKAVQLTRESFLANMSHELRTPLNGILGLSDLLLAEAQDSGYTEIVGDLEQIQSSGNHLLTLIEDILDVSQQATKKVSFQPEKFCLDSLVQETIDLVQPLVAKNQNRIVWQERYNLGAILGDRKRVKQIISNLLSNAAKFTHNGDIVITIKRQSRNFLPPLIDSRQIPAATVPAFSDRPAPIVHTETHLESDWIICEISDTGIGMSQQEIEQSFAAFQQGELGTTKKYPGAGLGLTICKSSCEMMGGNIKVSSTPGEGSTFTFWLPATLITAPQA